MDDENVLKVMASLGLNYNPAINSTKQFENRIASLNKQLAEMKMLAMQGTKDINNTFSSQLGSMTGAKTILDQYGKPLKTIQTQMAQIGTTSTKSYTSATTAAKQYSKAVKDVAKQHDMAGMGFQQMASFFVTGSLFYGTINGAKEAVKAISEVEMGIVEIQKVTEDSTFVFNEYRDELLQMGVDYGQSFENVQDIALRWVQAGYNVKDSLDNTKTSLLALNTAELDAQNSTGSLIGIMAQWEMTSAELPLLLDKINKTADDFTVTSQDLVDGLLRSSGAARIMNLDINETIALLTVMREASGRTGAEVGNALNSILSYIQRPGSIKSLESMGINMFADEAKTQFRSVMEVFQDIASKWGTASDSIKDGFVESADDANLFSEELATALGMQAEWNDLQTRDISQASAGVYRRNYFIGMIERLAEAQDVLNGLTTASGYSQKENANTMDTLEKKYQSLKTASQQLAVALGDAGLLNILKGLTDGATNAASSVSKLTPEMKALLTTSLEIIGISAALNGAMGLFTSKNLLLGAGALLPGWSKLLVIIPAVVSALGLYAFNAKSANDATNGLREKQDKLTETYKSQLKAIDDTQESMLAEAKEAETLAQKLEYLNSQESLNVSEQAQMKAIVDRLNGSFSDLGLGIDENTGKVIGNTSAIWDNIEALKNQAIAQAYQTKMTATASAYVEQELLVGNTQNELDVERANNFSLQSKKNQMDTEIARLNANAEKGIYDPDRLAREIAAVTEKYGGDGLGAQLNSSNRKIKELTGLAASQNISLFGYDKELEGWVDKASEVSGTTSTGNEYVPSTDTPISNGSSGSSGSSSSYSNDVLDNALKALDYKKYINKLTVEDEIATLKQIKANNINTADELMDINKRIYSAEQELLDEQLQAKEEALNISKNWIAEETQYGKLSVDEQIAAYNRVLEKQLNNIDAVKYAQKGLFDTYKDMLSEEQKAIKDAYDERIRAIDEETEKKKQGFEDEKSALQEQLDLLDRKDSERSRNQEMKSLQEELAYWQVRTSEEARKKVVELEKQIDEEKYKYDLDQKKQSISDKMDAIDDEIDEVEQASKEEKEKWEKSYKLTEKAFDEHSANIVALAGAMSKDAYEQWEVNYLTPLKNALLSGDFDNFNSIGSGLESSINGLNNNAGNSNNAQIYSVAKSILSLKKQWTDGDASAAQNATQYYSTLKSLGATGIADFLSGANLESAKSFIEKLPKFHDGGWAYSDGLAVLKKDELTFPPDLSVKMDGLLTFLKGNQTYNSNSKISNTDNRKEIKFDSLLRIDKNYMEDDVDGDMLARELGRQILKL